MRNPTMVIFFALLAGCSSPQKVYLPVDRSNSINLRLWEGPPGCPGSSGLQAADAFTASLVVSKIVGYVVELADKKLQDELKLYTAVYSSAASGPLYAIATDLRLKSNCFEFSRSANGVSAMTLTGELSLEQFGGKHRSGEDSVASGRQNGALRLVVRPLKLSYGSSAVKTTGEIGVIIKAELSTIWREANRGYKQESEPVTLIEQKIAPDGVLKNINIGPSPEHSIPLAPWSSYPGQQYGGNWTTLTITVAEAGNKPWLLENGTRLFHDNKEKVSGQVSEALAKLLQ